MAAMLPNFSTGISVIRKNDEVQLPALASAETIQPW